MSSDSPLYDFEDEDEYDFEQDYELEYSLDNEEDLINGRLFYEYESTQKTVENVSSPVLSPEATSALSNEKPLLIVETTENLDELLPSLDLMGLFDEESDEDDSAVTIDVEETADSLIELDLSYLADKVHFPIEEIENQDSTTEFEQSIELSDNEVSSSLDEVYESEDFFAEKEEKDSSDSVDHSEMYFDSDDEEYDLSWADDIHVEVGGKLTKDDRAWQVAMEVAAEYELDQGETENLAEIFIANGWSACRIAMERELSQGTSLEELLFAAEVKEVWEEYPEFYNEFETAYRIMSWPLALSILCSFEGYPVIEEIEQMLLRLFEHWRRDKISTLIFRTFLEYLYDKFGHTKHCSAFLCEWKVEGAKFVEDGYFLPPGSDDIPPLINNFTPDKWLANVRRFNSY